HHRHALEAPVLRKLLDDLVDLGLVLESAEVEELGVRPDGLFLDVNLPVEVVGRRGIHGREVRLVEELQSALTTLTTRAHDSLPAIAKERSDPIRSPSEDWPVRRPRAPPRSPCCRS